MPTITGAEFARKYPEQPIVLARQKESYKIFIFYSIAPRHDMYDRNGGMLYNPDALNKGHDIRRVAWEDGKDPTKQYFSSLVKNRKKKDVQLPQDQSPSGQKKVIQKGFFDKTIFVDCSRLLYDDTCCLAEEKGMMDVLWHTIRVLKGFFDIQSAWGCYGSPVEFCIGCNPPLEPLMFAMAAIINARRTGNEPKYALAFIDNAMSECGGTFDIHKHFNWTFNVEYKYIEEIFEARVDIEVPKMLNMYLRFEKQKKRFEEIKKNYNKRKQEYELEENRNKFHHRGLSYAKEPLPPEEEVMIDPGPLLFNGKKKKFYKYEEVLDVMIELEDTNDPYILAYLKEKYKTEYQKLQDEWYDKRKKYADTIMKYEPLVTDVAEVKKQIEEQTEDPYSRYAQAHTQGDILAYEQGEQHQARQFADYQGEYGSWYDTDMKEKSLGYKIDIAKRDEQEAYEKARKQMEKTTNATDAYLHFYKLAKDVLGLASTVFTPLSLVDMLWEIAELHYGIGDPKMHAINIGIDAISLFPCVGGMAKKAIGVKVLNSAQKKAKEAAKLLAEKAFAEAEELAVKGCPLKLLEEKGYVITDKVKAAWERANAKIAEDAAKVAQGEKELKVAVNRVTWADSLVVGGTGEGQVWTEGIKRARQQEAKIKERLARNMDEWYKNNLAISKQELKDMRSEFVKDVLDATMANSQKKGSYSAAIKDSLFGSRGIIDDVKNCMQFSLERSVSVNGLSDAWSVIWDSGSAIWIVFNTGKDIISLFSDLPDAIKDAEKDAIVNGRQFGVKGTSNHTSNNKVTLSE